MFDLDLSLSVLLVFSLLCVCGFEFINGFHDTANAVATVIYTNSLKPRTAVFWSAVCNFLGVYLGGISVAIGIVNLLPVETLIDQDISHSIGMVLALLLTAIIWNLGTWYYGIPCSSSHTLIGSILGVGLAYSFYGPASVNWDKAGEVGLSLLISPLFGFGLAAGCVWLLRRFAKNPRLFQDPTKGHPVDQLDETSTKHKPKPPFWIRLVLIGTCTGVSFAHGSNDGQKGVGLMMLVLIGIVPGYFALNMPLTPTDSPNKNTPEGIILIARQLGQTLDQLKAQPGEPQRVVEMVRQTIDSLQHKAEVFSLARRNPEKLPDSLTARVIAAFGQAVTLKEMPFLIRKDIFIINSRLTKQLKAKTLIASKLEEKQLKDTLKNLRGFTDYAPGWVLFAIALSLGIGTTVGWKRIVITIGEKIGKSHLTYAQGASAELVAASTIAASTGLGLPVSTTHVLSSGIAGTMAIEGGLGNLQPKTIRSIALAWVLTLPVCIGLSAGLFILFRSLL